MFLVSQVNRALVQPFPDSSSPVSLHPDTDAYPFHHGPPQPVPS
jgi:hypothetical protein